MPKENTHLYAAHKIVQKLENQDLRGIIVRNIHEYYLGSISIDTMVYYPGSAKASDFMHGMKSPTNEFIVKLLDSAKQTHSAKDLAFAFGLITHAALDATMHPLINRYAGDFYDNDTKKRRRAVYIHRYLETKIDQRFNKLFRLQRDIALRSYDGLSFPIILSSETGIPPRRFNYALRIQVLTNRLFNNHAAYWLATMMYKLGILQRTVLGVFYHHLLKDQRSLRRVFDEVRKSGPVIPVTILLRQGMDNAAISIAAAYKYYLGSITRKQLFKAIPYENLDSDTMISLR